VDKAEELARAWFASQGFSKIIHEPNGRSTFPDFLLDNSVLAEVTWLFQTEATTRKPLVEKEKPLLDSVIKFFEEKGRGSEVTSYFVDFVFERPLFDSRREFEAALEKALAEGIKRSDGRTRIHLKSKIWIEVYEASKHFGQTFVLGCWIDNDEGGWVREYAPKSLEAAVARKSAKAVSHSDQVSGRESWLILVDRMGCTANDFANIAPDFRPYTSLVVLGFNGEIARWSAGLAAN